MKKRKTGRTLSRDMSQRKALLRTLLVSLIENKSIKTTLAKAKELRPFAERQVTYAKKGLAGDSEKINSIRLLKKNLPQMIIGKFFDIAKILKDRKGGYLRIVKLGARKSDSAEMAVIEWLDKDEMSKKDDKKVVAKKEVKEKKDKVSDKKDNDEGKNKE
ncbi:MAG: 50S ribosomal protein L17 [Patescibacteria group bacterium]|jgi:large subunit ribosomal protein L17|nr:50S ribosomal protein L17 [Patescibacteria group bacterium]